MKDIITPEVFDHLITLAALEVDAAQAEYLRRELNNQLEALGELEAIPLDDSLPPASHGVPYTPQTSPALRSDDWQPCENPQRIIEQAPQVEEGYIVVPDIPHTTLK